MSAIIHILSHAIPEHWKVSIAGSIAVVIGYVTLKLEILDAWLNIITKSVSISVGLITFLYIGLKIYFMIIKNLKGNGDQRDTDTD